MSDAFLISSEYLLRSEPAILPKCSSNTKAMQGNARRCEGKQGNAREGQHAREKSLGKEEHARLTSKEARLMDR